MIFQGGALRAAFEGQSLAVITLPGGYFFVSNAPVEGMSPATTASLKSTG